MDEKMGRNRSHGNLFVGAFSCVLSILLAIPAGRAAEGPSEDGPIRLTDVTRTTGIDFVHTDGSYGKGYMEESMTGGLAIFDYHGDGKPDIYFTNGAPIGGRRPDPLPTHTLYHNEGGFRFRDVSAAAGVRRHVARTRRDRRGLRSPRPAGPDRHQLPAGVPGP